MHYPLLTFALAIYQSNSHPHTSSCGLLLCEVVAPSSWSFVDQIIFFNKQRTDHSFLNFDFQLGLSTWTPNAYFAYRGKSKEHLGSKLKVEVKGTS
jgi:hypothetical protein